MNDPSRQALERASIQRAAGGDAQTERELIQALTPIIQASVARTMRRFARRGRQVEQEVEDVTQGVLLALFAEGGESALSRWEPDRGLTLQGFVALLAAHETVSILRSRRRSPWTEVPTVTEALDAESDAVAGPEAATDARRMIAAVVERVRGRVSERGGHLFELLFLEERSPQDVCALTGLALPAVYTWSSRLARVGREVAAELDGEASTAPWTGAARALPASLAGAAA